MYVSGLPELLNEERCARCRWRESLHQRGKFDSFYILYGDLMDQAVQRNGPPCSTYRRPTWWNRLRYGGRRG